MPSLLWLPPWVEPESGQVHSQCIDGLYYRIYNVLFRDVKALFYQRQKKHQTSSSSKELTSQVVRTLLKQSWDLRCFGVIVTEQLINACPDGPKDLLEFTTRAQQYLIAHKQQLGVKRKTTVQPKCAEQRKPTHSKPDTRKGRPRSLQATDAKVMATGNWNVRPKSVLARIRRV